MWNVLGEATIDVDGAIPGNFHRQSRAVETS